jgi:predicted deacetylase
MAARYLIRFDDICPTMNWSVWAEVERILRRDGVRPIVAVVPDNLDPKLRAAPARADFWHQVRGWQASGWTIGWHGYQHLYSSRSAGVIGIHAGSEFAGHEVAEQRAKLRHAWRIFEQQGVLPKVWVAPGHSFDMTTVSLLREFGVHVVSDGFYWRAVDHGECRWLPQQLWRFRRLPAGLWTVCLHINSWQARDVEHFGRMVGEYAESIVAVDQLLAEPAPRRGVLDAAFSRMYRSAVVARQGRTSAADDAA